MHQRARTKERGESAITPEFHPSHGKECLSMTKRVLALQHVWENPVGLVGTLLQEYGIDFDIVNVEQERLPDPARYAAIVAFGGSQHVYEDERYPYFTEEKAFLRQVIACEIPYLGICLGGQLLASALGAAVRRHHSSEIGFFDIPLTPEGLRDPLYTDLPGYQKVFHWHEDVFELPTGAVHLATNAHTPNQAFRFGSRAYGLQYHIELTPSMLNTWLHHPAFQKELIDTLGIDAYTSLEQSIDQHYPIYQSHTRTMFTNFLRLGRII
jgi:GMP synthase (glutamine-hydrolysing)